MGFALGKAASLRSIDPGLEYLQHSQVITQDPDDPWDFEKIFGFSPVNGRK